MMFGLHNWRRFWCAREDAYWLGADGFLIDPETEVGRHAHDVSSLEQLEHLSLLALLGEPGIGKSTILRQEQRRLREAGFRAEVIDLSRAGSPQQLQQALASAPDYLFLDALDEGVARDPALISALIAIFDQHDLSTFRVRITCRTLEWPAELERYLRGRADPDALGVFELLPLRRADVVLAATDDQLDSEAFVEQVKARDASALAIRPLTLRFLLAIFAADGTLPHSKVRLFDEGTLILCTEEAALQRGHYHRNPDVFRRRAIAARLAAASTFTNRDTIVRDAVEDPCALPASVAIGREQLPNAEYVIDPAALEDVLVGTALFTGRTATVFAWNHQTYREFLAAWYLAQHDFDAQKSEALYFSTGSRRIPSPLREVAAWHAAFEPSLFDLIVKNDPQVLLRSDSAASTESRAQLATSLLARFARFEATDSWSQRLDYQKLDHPELAHQLRPYITTRSENLIVRRAAIEIARMCCVTAVADNLIAVLLNSEDDIHLRECAAHSLASLGGEAIRTTFTAILQAGIAHDPNDEILGTLLRHLWPSHIDVPSLFQHMRTPRRDDYYGAYQGFLAELPGRLAPDQLVPALEWTERLGTQSDFHIQQVQAEFIDRAVQLGDRDEIRPVLVRLIRASLHERRGAWYADRTVRRDRTARTFTVSTRRHIAYTLICSVDDDRLATELIYFTPPLLTPDDIQWLTNLVPSSSESLQRSLARCVSALYARFGYPLDVDDADAVVSVEARAFVELIEPWVRAVDLSSPEAKEAESNWRRFNRTMADNSDDDVSDADELGEPSFASIVTDAIGRVERGEIGAWVRLSAWADHFPKPITDHPEWSALEPGKRQRIVFAALRYLESQPPPDPSWVDATNEIPWTAIAARSAFQIVATECPALLDSLSSAVWRRWIPVLVSFTLPNISPPARCELFNRCIAFDELPAAILRVGRRDSRPGRYATFLSELPDPLPEQLHEPILQLLPELQDEAFENALQLLRRARCEEAREIARVTVRELPPARAARAARAALPFDASLWSVLIDRARTHAEFVDGFAPLVAHREDMRADVFATIAVQDAATLLDIVLQQHPNDDGYRGPRGAYTVLDYVERLKSSLLRLLRENPTDDKIRALEWLQERHQNVVMFRIILLEARNRHVDDAWVPLTVDQLTNVLAVEGDNENAPTIDALPKIDFVTPQRRDVDQAELVAILGGVQVVAQTVTVTETAALQSVMRPLVGASSLVVGSLGVATYTVGAIGRYAVAHFQSDMGIEAPNAAALATNDVLRDIQPKVVFQVGIGFGLKQAKQRLGDVLVAQHITSYAMIAMRPDTIEERGETLRGDVTLIERIRAHARTWNVLRDDKTSVAVHVGQMLSGPVLVNNKAFRDGLVGRFPSAIGGEMEGTGAYAAAARNRVPTLLLKGICDWADDLKDDRAQAFAAFTAVDLFRYVLDKPDALASLGVISDRERADRTLVTP